MREVIEGDDLDAVNAGNGMWRGFRLTLDLFAAARRDGVLCRMFIAELDGAPVGYADAVAAPIADGHRGRATVFVQPAARGHGMGAQLWAGVLGACSADRVGGVMVSVDAADMTSRAIAEAAGLRSGGLHQESELDLTGFGSSHNSVDQPVDGTVLATLPDDASEEQWRRVAEVYYRLSCDAPDFAAGAEPPPSEVFRTFIVEPWQFLGLWHRGDLVGLTMVMIRDRAAGQLNTFFTGVDRGFRSRGAATALKRAHVQTLRDRGWISLTTQNMTGNAHILASNARLGFRRGRTSLDMTFDWPTRC